MRLVQSMCARLPFTGRCVSLETSREQFPPGATVAGGRVSMGRGHKLYRRWARGSRAKTRPE
jgi:hypothetical protein